MSFGANLRRERELRGITLEEIAKETKISARLLDALETDRFDILPGGVFRRGFIRTYARYIGLNEDKILQEYSMLAEETEPEAPVEEQALVKHSSAAAMSWSVKVTMGLLLAIVLGVTSLWYLHRGVVRSQQEADASQASAPQPSPVAVSQSSVSQPTPPPTLPSSTPTDSTLAPGTAAPSAAPTAPGPELKVLGELAKKPEPPPPAPVLGADGSGKPGEMALKVAVVEDTWISVESGQKTLYSGLLHPEDSKSFSLQQPLKFTLGNAGGVRISVNGRPLASLGKSGEVRVLEINSENYQQYLSPNPNTPNQ